MFLRILGEKLLGVWLWAGEGAMFFRSSAVPAWIPPLLSAPRTFSRLSGMPFGYMWATRKNEGGGGALYSTGEGRGRTVFSKREAELFSHVFASSSRGVVVGCLDFFGLRVGTRLFNGGGGGGGSMNR